MRTARWRRNECHAEDITLENVRLSVCAADARPALHEEDVRGVRKQNCEWNPINRDEDRV